ncbi:MAG: lipid-A-disaccharide synthase [Pseudomonadales bacterium]|nr:MAG: lipid-A-disaccharide synthase [Pseudomonadales bacterium]
MNTDTENTPITDEPLVIGIVAGEVSGDSLGADFMRQMNAITEKILWVGVGGEQMQAEGLTSLIDMSRLSVMGLAEVITHLPDLFNAKKTLLQAFNEMDIDCFIGIDAPDFNLRIAKKLKKQGVFTVQYVSPSIWAWRENRIHSIKKATNLVLCLFPFELELYQKHKHPAVYVGHHLLKTIDKHLLTTDMLELRNELIWQIPTMKCYFADRKEEISKIICVMPGSREGEVKRLLPTMLKGMELLLGIDENLCFIIPTVSEVLQEKIEYLLFQCSVRLQNAVNVTYEPSQANLSQQVMAMSDFVLLASGTATLEAMLLNRPMVVVYKLNKVSYKIAKRLVKIPYISLPNILAGKQIVYELIQDDVTPENISRDVSQTLNPEETYQKQKQDLQETRDKLQANIEATPAHAFIDYLTKEYQ